MGCSILYSLSDLQLEVTLLVLLEFSVFFLPCFLFFTLFQRGFTLSTVIKLHCHHKSNNPLGFCPSLQQWQHALPGGDLRQGTVILMLLLHCL